MAEVTDDWRNRPQRGFFLGKRTDAFAGFDYCIEIDVIASESHTCEVQVTENPVEAGAPVADHIILKPDTLDLDVVVSDVSIRPNGAFPPKDPFTSIISRSASAFQFFKDLMRSKVPFDYQSGFELHRNMVIERISARQDAGSAAVFEGRLSLKEVRILTTETVTYPPRKAGKVHRQASKPVDAGEKKTDPVTQKSSRASAAEKVAEMLGVPKGFFFGGGN